MNRELTRTIIEVESNTPEWLELRRGMIGASDAPAIMGVCPHRTPIDVAMSKRADYHQEENEYMARGHKLEQLVGWLFRCETGMTLCRSKGVYTVTYDDGMVIGATPDRIILGVGLVECKTHNISKLCEYGPHGTSIIPPNEYAQVQHQMLATGKKKVYLASLFASNDLFRVLCHMIDCQTPAREMQCVLDHCQFRYYEILRDDEYIEDIIGAERKWWNTYMTGAELPCDYSTYDDIGDVVPIDGTDACAVDAYAEERSYAKSVETRLKEHRQAVECIIGTRGGVDTGKTRITWKRTKDKDFVETDWRAVAEELRNEVEPSRWARAVGCHTVREVKRGFRRMVVKAKKGGE